jgi:hypothetical protein
MQALQYSIEQIEAAKDIGTFASVEQTAIATTNLMDV